MRSRFFFSVLTLTFALVAAAPSADRQEETSIIDGNEPEPYNVKNHQYNDFVKKKSKSFKTGSGSGGNGIRPMCSCGIANSRETRIVNGQYAEPNEFPWQVNVNIEKNGTIFSCGGAIISKKHVITAAHCTMNGKLGRSGRVEVMIGSHDISTNEEITIPAAKVKMHKKYNPYKKRHYLDYDIAIIELREEIDLNNPKYGTVCLPSSGEDHTGKNVTISGWGRTDDWTYPNILRKTQLTVVSQDKCREKYVKLVTDRIVCAGGTGISSTCFGDSGGGLTYVDNGHHELVGLASFVPIPCNERGSYDGFTRVANPKLMRWIKYNVEGAETCN